MCIFSSSERILLVGGFPDFSFTEQHCLQKPAIPGRRKGNSHVQSVSNSPQFSKLEMRGKHSFCFPPNLQLQVRFHSSSCSSFNYPFLYFLPARNPSCIYMLCEASLLSNSKMQPYAPSHILGSSFADKKTDCVHVSSLWLSPGFPQRFPANSSSAAGKICPLC